MLLNGLAEAVEGGDAMPFGVLDAITVLVPQCFAFRVARAPNGIALPQEGGKSFRCREGKGLVRVCFHDKGMTAMGSAATAMGLPTGGGLGGVRGQTGSDEADDFERDGNHA